MLVNPISKISVCFALSKELSAKDLRTIAVRSSLLGLLLLVAFTCFGSFILSDFFNIKIYSLQLSGGLILFIVGLHALQKGEFFEIGENGSVQDMSFVPIGMPLIAGPATITAAISRSASFGYMPVVIAITLALGINLIIMLFSIRLGAFMSKWRLLGPLVRITGLFIAAIGADMALAALSTWLKIVI